MTMRQTVLGATLVLIHASAASAATDAMPAALAASYTVRLALSLESDLSPRAVVLMRAEIERIWQPYGVAIGWEAPALSGSGTRLRMTIADAELDRPQRSTDHAALAWIWFATPTRPGNEIRVSVDAARKLVTGVRVGGRSVSAWPGMPETLLGRALGRSIAHEVGHFLLVSPQHAEEGLMRAIFRPDDLLTFRAADYALAPSGRRALANIIGPRPCPSRAARPAPARDTTR